MLLNAGAGGRVVRVEHAWGGASGRRWRLWLVTNAAEQTTLGLNRSVWDESQLEPLREELNLPHGAGVGRRR